MEREMGRIVDVFVLIRGWWIWVRRRLFVLRCWVRGYDGGLARCVLPESTHTVIALGGQYDYDLSTKHSMAEYSRLCCVS